MKRIAATLVRAASLAAVCGLGVSAAAAGEVYGKVTLGGASAGEGVSVGAQCGDRTFGPATTDKSGTYHLVVGATGKCTMTLSAKGQSATLAIVSYEDAAQYDVALEAKDGKLTARRR